jgi:nitrogen-specific signal transduction histidine kinase
VSRNVVFGVVQKGGFFRGQRTTGNLHGAVPAGGKRIRDRNPLAMPSKTKNPKASSAPAFHESSLGSTEWAAVLDLVSDPISVHSATGEILWANEKLCEIYSRPLSELRGLSYEEAFHAGTAAPTEDHSLAAARQESEVAVSGKEWSVTVKPFAGDDKSPGFIRVMRDITEQHRLRRHQLEEERFASLGQMLFGIAHNVGTPLNIISGYAEFLLMRTKPDEQGRKELTAILDQSKRIAVLLNEALDVARPDQRQTSAIEIKVLLADSLDLGSHYFRKTGVAVGLTCAMSAPLIYGEAPRLRQAFFSLVLNASQSVGAGGRLEIVIAESRHMPGFVSVSLLGTEATGRGHDFSRTFESMRGNASEGITSGVGLLLARLTLDEAGAVVTFDESEERGVSVAVHMAVKSGGKP